jgi:hypothetical protein
MTELAIPEHNGAEVALIPSAARGLVQWAQSARAAYALAQSLVGTSFCPQQYRGKPEEATAAMLAGAEVGLSPMASLRAFDVIQGQAAPRAITLRAIVQSHGHEIEITEQTPTVARGRAKRKGTDHWQSAEWTIARAKQMKLTDKPNWQNQPQAMLVARLTGELARLIAADAILGIAYTAEEAADAEPEQTVKVARTVQRKPPVPEPTDHEPDPEPEPQEIESEPLFTDEQGETE